ncbi:MAG: VPLPA-CTERM sorting domain-containing protein [Pseudomonadota bacterium]
MTLTRLSAAFAALLATASVAGAATITITDFNPTDYSAATAGGSFVGTDFEAEGRAMGEGQVGSSLSTSVGTFSRLSGVGSGGTVRDLPGNDGTQLALRDGNVYGRSDTHGGSWFLDSNDTHGMVWNVSTGSLFDTVVFTITDGSEFGGSVRVSSGGESADQGIDGRRGDGNVSLVTVIFDNPTNAATIILGHYANANSQNLRTNDGFSIDGTQVGLAPVPLPASLPLLLLGAGALYGLRRRAQG